MVAQKKYGLTTLGKREEMASALFARLGISLARYPVGERAVHALVSSSGQCFLRHEHWTEEGSERVDRSYEREDRRFGGPHCTTGRPRSHSAYLAGLLH